MMELEIKEGSEPLNIPHIEEIKNTEFSITKRSAGQSMLDLAVLMANSSQLKTILFQGQMNPFYTFIVSLLIISIFLLIVVGVLLIGIAYFDLNGVKQNDRQTKMNNLATLLIFSILIINILIAAFGFQDRSIAVSVSP